MPGSMGHRALLPSISCLPLSHRVWPPSSRRGFPSSCAPRHYFPYASPLNPLYRAPVAKHCSIAENGKRKLSQASSQESREEEKKHELVHSYRCSVLFPIPTSLSQLNLRFPFPSVSSVPGSTPLLLLLLTPAFASLLDHQQEPFLKNCLASLFKTDQLGAEIDVLAAVVDRIPSPTFVARSTGQDLPSLQQGADGFSICVTDSHTTAPDLWLNDQSSAAVEAHSDQKGSLIISITLPDREILESGEGSQGLPRVSHTAIVPLANTMFTNGRMTTLTAQRFQKTGSMEETVFKCTRTVPLLHQELLFHGQDEVDRQGIVVKTPRLQSLTPPRIVSEAMGNVVRKVRATRDSEVDFPASQELEAAVNKLRNDVHFRSRRMEIWARVLPQERLSSLPTRLASLNAGLLSGYRLLRVLSGGGGWGNKQGLIALDPESTFDSVQPKAQANQTDEAQAEDYMPKLQDIVRPGDVLQFLSVLSPFRDETRPGFGSGRQRLVVGPVCLKFGSMASPAEELAAETISKVDSNDLTALPFTMFENHFGALSERGISYRAMIRGRGNKGTASPSENLVETKLPPNGYVQYTDYHGSQRRTEVLYPHQDSWLIYKPAIPRIKRHTIK